MGYAEPFSLLSRYAGQEARSTTSVRCKGSSQRGSEKVSLKYGISVETRICL